jgi:hypothetical protein
MNLNPMGINGPTSPAPYQQPNAANPTPNPSVGVRPHQPGTANPLGLVWPLPRYLETGLSAKDDPSGIIRAR